MDRVVDLVRQLEPATGPPPAGAEARQREALVRSWTLADEVPVSPRRLHPRRGGWFVALAGAAAVVVAVALLGPGSSPPSRPPTRAPGTSAVLTAVITALAKTGGDVEEAQSAVPGAPLSATSWVDLASGACRTDTSLAGQRSFTVFDEHGNVVFIDYAKKQWWTSGSSGVTCEPLTPQTIEHAVSTGQYTVAGHATVEGQPSLKLAATATTSGLHPVTKLVTLWVNATTYLPIQSTATGHLTEHTAFTWLPATATTTAVLDVTVPRGFQQVAPPPTQVQVVP